MYKRLACLFLCGTVLFSGWAVAQAPTSWGTGGPSAAASEGSSKAPAAREPKPHPKGMAPRGAKGPVKGKEGEAAEDTAPAPPPPPSKPKDGDVITLNDGTVIDGVQIVKESPKELVLQIISGVELAIPRAQVKSVKRDNISAQDAKRSAAAAAQPESSGLLPGMKFSGKLSTDISKPPASFKNEDLGVVLAEMCKRAGVDVVLDQSVSEIPPAERRWTYQLDPNTPMTLFNLLKDVLPRQFPTLEALYLEDKIVVATKKASETLKSQGALEIPGPEDASAKTEAAAAPGAPAAPAAPPPPAAPAPANAAATPPAPTAPAAPAAPAAPKS